MRLRYTARALRHLRAIAAYITERNPPAARHVGMRIRETAELLAGFPDTATHDAAFLNGVTFSAARWSPIARVMKRAVIGVPS